MIQVKEFLNCRKGGGGDFLRDSQYDRVNDWLQEKKDIIEVIDIKYSVGTFQESNRNSRQEYSGVLVVYKLL